MCRAALEENLIVLRLRQNDDGLYLMFLTCWLPELVCSVQNEKEKKWAKQLFYFSPLMETLISPFTLRKAMIALLVN
jgi:hypothetical protein